jgi:hypothetical protein
LRSWPSPWSLSDSSMTPGSSRSSWTPSSLALRSHWRIRLL